MIRHQVIPFEGETLDATVELIGSGSGVVPHVLVVSEHATIRLDLENRFTATAKTLYGIRSLVALLGLARMERRAWLDSLDAITERDARGGE